MYVRKMQQRYNIKLTTYNGQPMDMLVWGDEAPWEGTYDEAKACQTEYTAKNPGGKYVIRPVPKTSFEHLMEDST